MLNYNLKYCQKYYTFLPSERIEIGHNDNANLFLSAQIAKSSRTTATENWPKYFHYINNVLYRENDFALKFTYGKEFVSYVIFKNRNVY